MEFPFKKEWKTEDFSIIPLQPSVFVMCSFIFSKMRGVNSKLIPFTVIMIKQGGVTVSPY